MGAERRNYVMSVELAMQREMAYRQKLHSLTTKRGGSCSSISSNPTSSNKDPLHYQLVMTSTSSQASRMIPGPIPNPCPVPTLGLFPNPRPYPYFGQRPGQVPPLRPDTWYCGETSGPVPHVKPSFPRLISIPSPTSGPTHSANHRREQPHQVGNFYCNLCEVDCTTAFNLNMHLNGLKHRAKLNQANGTQTKEAGGKKAKVKAKERVPYECELCGIWCIDELSLRLHLNGKNHIADLQDSEKKLKGPDGGSIRPHI